jgi:hypothetical protein
MLALADRVDMLALANRTQLIDDLVRTDRHQGLPATAS